MNTFGNEKSCTQVHEQNTGVLNSYWYYQV